MSDVTVTQSMIDEFERDGVICVRGLIGMPLVERLRLAVADILEDPSAVAVDSPDTGPADGIARKTARFRQAMNGWMRNDAYRDLVFNSPAPRVAAELMKSKAVRILYDQTLVKEPKSTVPVEWHHDLTFWPVSGDQICSTWIALDEVTKDNGPVYYLRGSHKWSQSYRPTVPDTPEFRALGILNLDLPAAPNYFEEPSADLITWDMQPGDALVFTARTLHGSGANTHSDRARRAIAPRFVGDDGRYVAGMHVLNLSFPKQPALHTGDELNDPLFPVAWEAA